MSQTVSVLLPYGIFSEDNLQLTQLDSPTVRSWDRFITYERLKELGFTYYNGKIVVINQ
jgi:hypothetical protein